MHAITASKAKVCMLIHFLAFRQEECAVLKGCVSEGVGTGRAPTMPPSAWARVGRAPTMPPSAWARVCSVERVRE